MGQTARGPVFFIVFIMVESNNDAARENSCSFKYLIIRLRRIAERAETRFQYSAKKVGCL